MPYVLIQVTREGVTAEQKSMMIRQSTDMLVNVLDKDPATTFVVVEEVDTDNWGVAGEPVAALRASAPQDSAGTSAASRRKADRQAIRAVVKDYLDGLYHCDTTRLERVFHPRALYATVAGGAPLYLTMQEYLPVVAQRDPPARTGDARRERLLAIDFAGPDTALVKLECSFFQKDYLDLLTFVRVDGRWQIISKVFHYEPAA
jgi:4-oxalocrotonate tautomerase